VLVSKSFPSDFRRVVQVSSIFPQFINISRATVFETQFAFIYIYIYIQVCVWLDSVTSRFNRHTIVKLLIFLPLRAQEECQLIGTIMQ
jgi:hypothetical protein